MRNRLVLAVPRARPATRLLGETVRLLRKIDFYGAASLLDDCA